MLAMAAFWTVLTAALRTALCRVGAGPDGGVPAYDPAAAAAAAAGSSSSGGPADIWGLGDKKDSRIFVGTYQDPFNKARTGPRSPGFERANEVPTPTNPYTDKPLDTGPNYATALEAMQELPKLYATNRAGYIALQQRLYQAGFYGSASPNAVGIGSYNEQTVSAYRQAVLSAAQLVDSGTPVTFDELLDQKDPAAAARGKKQVQPGYIAQYSDPQTVAAIAQQAAQTTLGRNLTTAEVKAFVGEFHAAEKAWNSGQKTSQVTAAGGTDAAALSAPSAAAAADQFVQHGGRGVEATGNKLADFANVLRGLVGGDV